MTGSPRSRGTAWRRSSCSGPASGSGRCSCRSPTGRPGTRSSTASPTRAPRSSSTATPIWRLGGGDHHPGALDLRDDEPAIMLYTSGTTGRPKGVPRSHRAERAGALAQVVQHGYGSGDRTLGVMPLYHTMGDHSLLAMSLIERVLRLPARVGSRYRPWRWSSASGSRSLYLAPTLFHDLVSHPGIAEHDLSSVEAIGYAGAAMTRAPRRTRAPRPSGRASSSTTTGRPRSTRSRSTATRRRSRVAPADRRSTPDSGSSPRTRTPARTTSPARRRGADHLPSRRRTRRSRATGTGRTPTRRRKREAGTSPATSAGSTTKASCGSSAGSTT